MTSTAPVPALDSELAPPSMPAPPLLDPHLAREATIPPSQDWALA